MDYVRIWADDDGISHFEDVTLPFRETPAEAGVVEMSWSEPIAVDRVHFLVLRAVDQQPDWHRAPQRQFVTFLTGWVRLTARDGEDRTLPAGSTVLAEDLHGTGHVTEHEPGEHRVVVMPLDP